MSSADSLRSIIADAVRYWEKGRIAYNLALTAVVLGWLVVTWPHFQQALTLRLGGVLFILAVLANVCYCAAYLADIPLQYSSLQGQWRRWRWGLWLIGTLFAVVIANYLIADEIYPFVN